jgi:hypothetical protein
MTGRSCRPGWAAGAVLLLAMLPACSSHHHTTAGSAGGSGSSSAGSGSSSGATAASGKPSGSKPAGAKPSGSAGQPSGSASSGGSEGSTTGQVEKCPVTGSNTVGAAFAAAVAHEQVSTSGIGSPLCTFDLSHSKTGVFGAVSATAISNYPAAAFAQSRKSSSGAQPVAGLGTSAFYVPADHTLKVLSGSTALTLQYRGYLAGAGQPTDGQIRSALIAIARGYLSQH